MQNRDTIVQELQRYFKVSELVCPHTARRWGEQSWRFLDTATLAVLLKLRTDILAVPLVCNTATLTQRGLRCNLCAIPSNKTRAAQQYLSAHLFGKAFDLSSPSMTAAEMRRRIEARAAELPCAIRVERDVNWLHFDTLTEWTSGVQFFNP